MIHNTCIEHSLELNLGIIQEEQDVNAVDLFMELAKYYALEQYKFLMIGGGSQWPEIRYIKVR